ncbi:right-handed parallel beta-helix repeat-containing protein [Desertivirga xinjiangensis]|uniref:right-handed parallel beta-helix repeat-containing protein n=1 Tax=Desertivirga xinjiangensis TaxID=539206 RepID=UPI002108AB3D|nr:right-handed parallel beta-helix repeat-containing protein [Pedobacter xinjiangensis]
MEKFIDLSTVPGVTLGFFGAPPYTPQEYLNAHNNRIAIQDEIDTAYNQGYTKVSFKKCELTLGYELTVDSAFAGNGADLINLRSNTEYDFGFSKIEMMFDSANKSPYHTTVNNFTNPYQLNGRVITSKGANNVILRNLEIKGDIFFRSFANTNEKNEEQTYAFDFGTLSNNVRVFDCDFYGFMGDAFSSRGPSAEDNVLADIGTYYPGYFNGSSVIAKAGCYVTNLIDIDLVKEAANNRYSPGVVQVRRMGGVDRTPMLANPMFELVFFTAAGAMISRDLYTPFDLIKLPRNAAKVRMQIFNEVDGQASITHGMYSLHLNIPNQRHVEIRDCKIHDNHRGGISNMPDDCIIHYNEIYNNGLDSGIGAPLFPGTTRYQINIEDIYSANVTIENNKLYAGYHGILIGSETIKIHNNQLSNTGGIVIFRCSSAVIANNKVSANGGILPPFNLFDGNGTRGNIRSIAVYGNKFESGDIMIDLSASKLINTEIRIENNEFYGRRIYLIDGGDNISFVNNVLYFSNNGTAGASYSTLSNIRNIHGNRLITRWPAFNAPNNVRLYFNGYVEGSNNKIDNCRLYWGDAFAGAADPFLPVIKGFNFVKCTFTGLLADNIVSAVLNVTYEDCSFEDTELYPPITTAATFTNALSFKNCRFNISESYAPAGGGMIFFRELNNYTAGKDYILNMDNVEINNKKSAIPKLLWWQYNFRTYRIKVNANNVKATGMGDFLANINSTGVRS